MRNTWVVASGIALTLVLGLLWPALRVQAQAESGVGAEPAEADIEGTGSASPTRSQLAMAEAADRYERLGPDAASEVMLGYLLRNPDDRLTAVRYSHWLRGLDNFEASIAFLRRVRDAPELTPARQPEAAHELGALLARWREYDETIRTLELVTDSNAGTYEMTRMNLASAYQAAGRFAEARAIYAQIEGASMRLFADENDCEVVLAMDGHEAASACLRHAIERHGEHPALQHGQALVAYVAGDYEAARRHVDALFEAGSPGGRVDTLRALLAQRSGDPADGVQAVDALRQVTLNGESHAIRALALWRAERPDDAVAAYAAALDANPAFADAEQVARVLHWRPDDVAALRAIAAASSEAPHEGSGAQPASGSASEPARTGCCSLLGGHADGPAGELPGLGFAILLFGLAYRVRHLRR